MIVKDDGAEWDADRYTTENAFAAGARVVMELAAEPGRIRLLSAVMGAQMVGSRKMVDGLERRHGLVYDFLTLVMHDVMQWQDKTRGMNR